MGCGVSKQAVSSPVSKVESNPCEPRATIDGDQITAAEDLPLVANETKEILSSRSLSSKGSDSDADSDSSTEDESTERQPSPIRIKAQGEGSVPTCSSPVEPEIKKGFIAFDVPLDDSQGVVLDSVFKKPLPKRLRHLEPLGHTPQLTTEMLMSKLEKAEEKRQKALARRREHSARRKQLLLRKNEQMGDTVSATQLPEDMESDQSVMENIKSLKDVEFNTDAPQIEEPTVDGNTNWNEGQSDHLEVNKNSPSRPPEESEEIINQNNNSVETRIAVAGNCLPMNEFDDSSIPWPSSLASDNRVQKSLTKLIQSRYGCFLQAVQEEEEEDVDQDEEDDGSSLGDEKELGAASIEHSLIRTAIQGNNNSVPSRFYFRSKFRSKGF